MSVEVISPLSILLVSPRFERYRSAFRSALVERGIGVDETGDCLNFSIPHDDGTVSRGSLWASNAVEWRTEWSGCTVLWGWTFPSWLVRNLRDLAWVQTVSAGIEHLLEGDLVPHHVVITNARGFHGRPIAEYVIGALLAHARGILINARINRGGEVRRPPLKLVEGDCLGLLGTGSIGSSIATLARGLGMSVLGINRSGHPHPDCRETVAMRCASTVLEQSPTFVLTAPLTGETWRFLNEERVASLPEGALVINVGRAGLIDEAALIAACRRGSLSGAVLDVWEGDQPSEAMVSCENIVLTPHISGSYPGYIAAATDVFVDNLIRIAAREPLTCVIDRRRGY